MSFLNIFKKPIVITILFFLLLTAIFTFPLIVKMHSVIPGHESTDEPYGALWYFWWVKYAYLHNLPVSNIVMIAAPSTQIYWPGYIYWNLLNKGLTSISNPIVAYNLQVLSGFLLTGVFTYILGFYLLNNRLAALFSAIIFTYCPYHFAHSWQHLGLSFLQWMPLYIFSILHLHQKPTIKNAILVGVSFSVLMAFDLYYAYFMFIISLLFLAYESIYEKSLAKTLKLLKYLVLSALLVLLLEAVDLYHIAKFMVGLKEANIAEGAYGYIRPFEDLFSQSARPLSYFLPVTTHPVFGKFTEKFIGTNFYGGSLTEHALYLGWTPLFLALTAIRRWRLKRKQSTVHSPQSAEESFYIGLFVFIAIAAWFFSQPPWWKIGPLKICMPSFFLYKILPMFRAYCRFGIVVMLAVSVLAGYGLKFILARFKSSKVNNLTAILLYGLVVFEFWNYPPFRVIDVSRVPGVYYWLKKQPGDFIIAEYPLDTNGPNELYKFYQTVHEKKIINGTIPGTNANKVAKTITRLSDFDTVAKLKQMRAKYVLVHKGDYLQTGLINDALELEKILRHPGLKLVKSFPQEECPQKDIICVQKTDPIDVYGLQ